MKRLFSLKWQAVVFVSLVLLVGGGLFAWFGKSGLEQAYAHDRERRFQDRKQAVEASLENNQQQLVRLANHLQGVAAESRASNGELPLVEVARSNWGQLNFEWGVDGLVIADRDHQLLGKWGQGLAIDRLPDAWLEQVLREERPLTRIWCPGACMAVAMVPVMIAEDQLGVMYLASSLADAVLQFQAITSADIGIFVHEGEGASIEAGNPVIAGWQYRVVALTGIPRSLWVLQLLSAKNPLHKIKFGDSQVVKSEGNQFEIRVLPLGGLEQPGDIVLSIIDDISEDLIKLDRTVGLYLLVAVATTLGAEVVLLILLWRPMVRLQTVSTNLPRLAGSQREAARESLRKHNPSFLLRNEIHNLFDAAILLSDTLDHLDIEVRSRSEHLKKRRQELLEERNFVTRLLNHVHVVILTQNTYGELLLVNAEGRNLLGLKERRSGGQLFVEHLSLADQEAFNLGVDRLLMQEVREYRQETEFTSPSGKILAMEWYHSCLPDDERGRATILTVGLNLTERKQAEANLAWLADHDPLTEIYNRRRFQNEFQRALKSTKRTHQPGAVIIFDIDQFKSINDTGGHMVGDIVLQQVAWRLDKEIRETDVIARLGGDEFAILLENIGAEGAVDFVTKLCEQIMAVELQAGDNNYRISISAGVALFPTQGEAIEPLMANADFAMYAAKSVSNARNSWQIFSGSESEKSELRKAIGWKTRIQDALENNRLILHFQPILDIRKNRISHYEALVRMLGENNEIIAPGHFIPVAEKTGLIYEIDLRVVELAVRALCEFHRQGDHISLAVNLSAKAITNKGYIEYVDNLVIEAGMRQRDLIFELTETSAVEDVTHAAEVIAEFRRRGFRFSLDDFGVGFSSWYYLRQLSVDFVKLDGSFVKNMATDFEDRLFVKSINDVVQGLGKQSVAEFVGDEKTLQLLTHLGVNYAQGYFIGRPQVALIDRNYQSSGAT